MAKTTKKAKKKAVKSKKTASVALVKNSTEKTVRRNPNLLVGNPGNSGGKPGRSGRHPSAIRTAARLAFSERLPILEQIADDENGKPTDRIAAMKVLADTGGVDKIAIMLDEQPEAEGWTPERVAALWERVQRIKTVEQLEKVLVAAARKQATNE